MGLIWQTQISLYANQNAEIVWHSNKIKLIKFTFQGFVIFFRFEEITGKNQKFLNKYINFERPLLLQRFKFNYISGNYKYYI